jgi:glycosyltransferase involved in cell wall biosynthesis
MRWQDRDRGRLYTIASWIVCAAALPGRRKYDVFVADNLHIPPVLMKLLFLRRSQKIVVYLGSHTLYFLYTHRYSGWVERLHLWALRRYDAVICEGEMAVDLVQRLLPESRPPLYEAFIGLPVERVRSLAAVRPHLDGKKIVCIAGGPGEFRMHYKGIDLMIDAVAEAIDQDPTIEFDIVGRWDDVVMEACLARLPANARSRIRFQGESRDISNWLQPASLYLQCTRGDATPTAVLEAMTAGMVPIVSEWTGARQVVGEVDSRLIVPLQAEELASRILWYFALDSDERLRLSQRCREAVANCTEEAAVLHFQETFSAICDDLGIAAPTDGGRMPLRDNDVSASTRPVRRRQP